jgi:cell division protein FtsL
MSEEDQNQTIKGNRISGLRTFKTDSEEYAQSGVSMVELAGRQTSGIKIGEVSKKPKIKKIIFTFFLVSIVLLAAGIVFYFYNKYQVKNELVYTLEKPILVSEEEKEVQINLADLKNSQTVLINALKTPVRINNLLYFSVVIIDNNAKINTSAQEFLNVINIVPPAQISESLNEKFMFSKFYMSKDWPILIFKLDDYDYAFSGAIKWEKNMADNFKNIFSLSPAGTGNSFADREIQSRDTRVLTDQNGNVVLIYAFINRKYLVITTGEEPLKEVFRRFSSSQYING